MINNYLALPVIILFNIRFHARVIGHVDPFRHSRRMSTYRPSKLPLLLSR